MIENLFTFVRTLGNQRIEGKKFFTTQIGVLGTLSDGTGAVGTTGKVLSSTGTGVEWVTVGSSNVADLDDLTDVVITTASTGQLLRFNGTSWVNWTPNFLTAYGSLNDLSDAVIATPTTGQLLRYNGTNWVNWTHNFLTTSANLNDLANVSVAGPTNGQILRYNAGTGLWIADDEGEAQIPTLEQVTTAGNTTTNGISAASFTATGFISGGNITGTKVTTPTVEFNGAISTNSVYQVDQGEPNPNVFYAKWNGDVQFTVNGDGYAIARTGYKVTGATGGFLKADGTIDTSTYLTSYTETQTLDSVTDLGNTTTNRITVGGVTVSAGGDVTSPVIYSPTLWAVNGPIRIMADESGSMIPDQGEPANPVIHFEWMENPLGHIDTDGKVTFNGFKTPSGTSSGFLKADGSIDTNTYLTSVAPYALDDLTDVSVDNPQDGDFLKYDDITGEWISAAIPTPTLDSVTTAGNTTANTIDVGGVTTPYVQFKEVVTPLESHRSVNWGEDHNSLEVYYTDEKHFDVGQDQMWYVKNRTEDTLAKGTVVMAAGAVGNSGKIAVAPLVADGTVSGRYAVGILMDDVRADEFGFAMTQGTIRGINTGEFAEGDTLYPDPLQPGALTNVEPASPALKLPIAFVVTSAQNGAIAVRMAQGLDLHEVHDVQITDGANGQLLQLQSGIWTNWTPNYLTTETDPVFTASAAATISTTNISNWNSAYGWGDHALAGYLTTYENNYISDVRISEFIVTFTGEGNAFNGDVDFSALPFAPVTHNHAIAEITGLETALAGKQPVGNYITTESDPTVPDHVKAITEQNIIDWDKAYGWGNHADYGYLTSLPTHTHAIADVTGLQTALDGKMPYYHGTISGDPGTAINGVTRIYPTANGPIGAGHFTVFTALQDSVNYGWQFTSVGNDAYFRSKDTTWGGWQTIATQSWVTSQGYLTTYENNYISDVRLAETTLSFSGEGSGFTGDIDLSLLPFAASSHTHIIGDVTGLQTALDGKVPTTRTLTINGTAFDLSANRSWTIDSADGYVSDVRLVESTLSFSGEGNAFSGSVDLSTLPFQPAGSYLTAEADTLATVTGRGGSTGSLVVLYGKVTLGNNTSGTYNGNVTGLTINSTAEIRSTGVQNPPALTWHYEGLATRHLLMTSGGALNFVSPSNEASGVAVVQVNGNNIWHAGNDGSGSGLDADLWDGYHIGQFSNWNSRGANDIVTGMLSWRNYGSNHVIFDASSGVSPTGVSVNISNPDVGWAGSYPTLMGWNGTNTYGVRVDSARVADSASSAGNADTVDGYHETSLVKQDYIFSSSYNWNTVAAAGTTSAIVLRVESAVLNPPANDVYNWSLWQQGNATRGSQIAVSAYGTQRMYFRGANFDTGSYQTWAEVIHSKNIGSQSVAYATSSGNSVSTDQTNFSELFIEGNAVATKEYVTSQGYLTSLPSHNHDDRYYTESESDGRFLQGTTNPSTPGNFTLSIGNNGTYSYVQSHSSQPLRLNPLGNALEGPSGSTIWHSGNDGSGSGLDADLFDGVDSIYFVKGNGVNTLGYRTTNNSGANSAGGLSSGFYDGYNMSNMPTVDWYHLITNAHNNSSTSNQYEFHIATPFWSKNDFYMRSISPNDVGSWKRLWSNGDFSSTSITNWNAAYGWGNHADAPYWNIELTDDIGVAASTVRFAGSIRIDGDLEVIGTITETSSIRFKENIAPLDPALDKVNQLEAVSYNKIGVDDREIGLIAEEVAELFPEVVTYNDGGQPQGIQYQRLSVILLKAVQELTERVNKLENK